MPPDITHRYDIVKTSFPESVLICQLSTSNVTLKIVLNTYNMVSPVSVFLQCPRQNFNYENPTYEDPLNSLFHLTNFFLTLPALAIQ